MRHVQLYIVHKWYKCYLSKKKKQIKLTFWCIDAPLVDVVRTRNMMNIAWLILMMWTIFVYLVGVISVAICTIQSNKICTNRYVLGVRSITAICSQSFNANILFCSFSRYRFPESNQIIQWITILFSFFFYIYLRFKLTTVVMYVSDDYYQ